MSIFNGTRVCSSQSAIFSDHSRLTVQKKGGWGLTHQWLEPTPDLKVTKLQGRSPSIPIPITETDLGQFIG